MGLSFSRMLTLWRRAGKAVEVLAVTSWYWELAGSFMHTLRVGQAEYLAFSLSSGGV